MGFILTAVESMCPIPQDLLDSAFNKIHPQDDALNSCKVAYETIKYSILIFKKTISIAAKAI